MSPVQWPPWHLVTLWGNGRNKTLILALASNIAKDWKLLFAPLTYLKVADARSGFNAMNRVSPQPSSAELGSALNPQPPPAERPVSAQQPAAPSPRVSNTQNGWLNGNFEPTHPAAPHDPNRSSSPVAKFTDGDDARTKFQQQSVKAGSGKLRAAMHAHQGDPAFGTSLGWASEDPFTLPVVGRWFCCDAG